MPTIKPTVGRVVLFFPFGHPAGEEPLAAQIATVHDDTLINVGALNRQGEAFPAQNVVLLDEGDFVPRAEDGTVSGDYAVWMPYQLQQAKASSSA